MKPFTKEQMALLEGVEPRMRQAQSDYLTSLFHDQKVLVEEIYRAAGGTRGIVWGCGSCWLAIMKEIAEQYFKQREEEAAKAVEKPKTTAPKKKATTKK